MTTTQTITAADWQTDAATTIYVKLDRDSHLKDCGLAKENGPDAILACAEYVEHARLVRQLCDGLKGVTIAEHDSHGLCYAVKFTSDEVKFSSDIVVYYDREGLEVVS